MIDDIKIDINKAKVGKEDKKIFNDLNRLITDISNNRVRKEDAVERLKKSVTNLDRLRQKQKTDFQNKMIHVVYQLFNSFGFNKEFAPLLNKTESSADEDESDTKQPTQLKQLNLNEISKTLWIEVAKKDFNSLIKDVVENLDNRIKKLKQIIIRMI